MAVQGETYVDLMGPGDRETPAWATAAASMAAARARAAGFEAVLAAVNEAMAGFIRALDVSTITLPPDVGARCHAAHQRPTTRRLLERAGTTDPTMHNTTHQVAPRTQEDQ